MLKKLYYWTLKKAEHPKAPAYVMGLAYIEAIFFPIPVDPLLMILGTAKPKKAIYWCLLAALFSVLGAITAYFIGYFFWDSVSPFLFEHIITEENFKTTIEYFQKYAFASMFVAGFTPLPFKVFTVSAGVAKLNVFAFIIGSALSRTLRFGLIGCFFYFLGDKAKVIIEKYFNLITWIVCILILVVVILWRLK